MHRALLGLLAVGVTACSVGDADLLRQAWLVDALVRDNAVWLPGREDDLAAKYAKMASDPYNYMRGSLAVALADSARPTGERGPNAFLTVDGTESVLIAVDPHPENLGSFFPGVQAPPTELGSAVSLVAEVNDLDGAQHGPWTWDVRRAALGVSLILWQSGCDVDCRMDLTAHFAEAYAEALVVQAEGGPGWIASVAPSDPGPLAEMVRRATDRGIRRDKLERFTDPLGVDRRIDFESADLPEGQSLEWVDEPAFSQLTDWLDRLGVPGPIERHHVARRRGQGVASLPAERYLVVTRWGQDGDAAWRLLTVREVVDPPILPNRSPGWVPTYSSNAQRLIASSEGLWSRADADGLFFAAGDGGRTFKRVSAGSFFERLDSGDVADRIVESADPRQERLWFVDDVGRLLAAAHARGTTASGASAAAVISADLAGRQGMLVDQVRRDAEVDLQRLLSDHALFVDALDILGPTLGHTWL